MDDRRRPHRPHVRPAGLQGHQITQAQCDHFLAADLAPVENAINALGAKLTQNQFDARASLAFNIGAPGFEKSTVARLLKAGDTAGAVDAILLWNKSAVLKIRRVAERRRSLTPDKLPVPVSAPLRLPQRRPQRPSPQPRQ